MKIVIKEWLKCKKALTLMVVVAILTIIKSGISSLNIIKLGDGFEHPELFWTNIWTVLLLMGGEAILGPLTGYLKRLGMQINLRKMQVDWYGNLVDSDFKMFTKYSCSRVYTTGEFIWSCASVMSRVIGLLTSLISIFATIYGMYFLGGKVIIPILIVYALSIILIKYLFSIYDKIDSEQAKIKHIRNQECEDLINGFAEVRAFGYQGTIHKNLENCLNQSFIFSMKKGKAESWTNIVFYLIDLVGTMIVFAYAMKQIQLGLMTSGIAMSLILYVGRIIDPLATFTDFISDLSEQTKFAKDYEEILNYVNTTKNGEIEMDSFEDSIKINKLSFAYKESSNVLRNINMTIHKGEHIGICGSSGNGKSTLAKLMLHFYEPTKGNITIDGIKLDDMTDSSFRKLVGTVQQENMIFPGTILKNITYGTNNALESEIIDACKRARIYDFIMSLDDKFDTEVGPRGLDLSGGQKQRIALARLFLKNPEIIILDEATSALDNETEGFVQDAIDELKDKTVITIAHRLTTIENCDQIYVLDKNTIAEHGTHKELMELNGKYAEMQTIPARRR